MNIKMTNEGEKATVYLSGSIDIPGAESLKKTLTQILESEPTKEVSIDFEEYEALNLCDYELLNQAEAARLMKISRPTFTRIYESVRRKIARTIPGGR